MDKLTKLSTDHKKLSRSVNGMKTTIKGLISEVKAMECKSISEQLNAIVARINAVENNLYDKGEIIPEAAALVYESEQKLRTLMNDLGDNQFIRLDDLLKEFDNAANKFDFIRREDLLKEIEKLQPELDLSYVDIFMVGAIGFLGGILGCAVWSYYG